MAAPRSLTFLRLRWSLFAAAGPLANLLLAAATETLPTTSPDLQGAVRAFFWSNVFVAASSLFPWWYTVPWGKTPSDGLALMSMPFTGRERLEQWHAAFFAFEAHACLRRKDYEQAEGWSQQGLREYPRDPTNRNLLGVALLGLDKRVPARELFQDLLRDPDITPENRALFLNNLAWTDLMLDDSALHGEADACSKEAMRLTPWVPAIQGTRGSILVEIGRVDEAIDLLECSFEHNEEPSNRALNACFLAIARFKQGHLAEARQYLEDARALDPDCALIPRVLRLLPQL